MSSGCNANAYQSGYTFNQYGTAATQVNYTRPTVEAGKQYCVKNSIVGGTGGANTGIIRVNAGTNQYIIYKGTIGAQSGYIRSGGAAGDAGCAVGVDASHWEFYGAVGVWTQDSGG